MIHSWLFKIARQVLGSVVLIVIQRLPGKRGPQPAPILVVVEGSGPRWRGRR